MEVAVGPVGDGHKWICDSHRFPSDCLVYSIGFEGDFHFELDLNRVAPQCEIHTFDPKDYSQALTFYGAKAMFHEWRLGTSYHTPRRLLVGGSGGGGRIVRSYGNFQLNITTKTLRETMKELGHEG